MRSSVQLACVLTFGLLFSVALSGMSVVFSSDRPVSPPSAQAGVASVYAADLNSNGAPDIVFAMPGKSKVAWYPNDGEGSFGDEQVLTDGASEVEDIHAADLNGEGALDVVSASERGIMWYENTDGYGSFSDRKVITTATEGAQSVYADDLDGDGDVDVLSASEDAGTVSWYENTDGNGSFSDQQIISSEAEGAQSVYTADLDGNGSTDVLSSHSAVTGTGKIAWYRSTAGGFASQNVVTTDAEEAQSVFAADLDGDDDNDILFAASLEGKIAWHENTNGYGSFSDQNVVTTNAEGAHEAIAADLTGNGALDLISAGQDGQVAWYENSDGSGTFLQTVVTSSEYGAQSASAGDIDGDGDTDFVTASSKGQITVYRNDLSEGEGMTSQQVILP